MLALVLVLLLGTRDHQVDNQAAWEPQQCMNVSHRGAKVENLSLCVYILHTPYSLVQHRQGRRPETHTCRRERGGSVSDAGRWKIIIHAGSESQLSQKSCSVLLIRTETPPFQGRESQSRRCNTEISGLEKLALGRGMSSFNFMLLMTVTGEGTRCKQMLNILNSRRDTVSGHGQPPMQDLSARQE